MGTTSPEEEGQEGPGWRVCCWVWYLVWFVPRNLNLSKIPHRYQGWAVQVGHLVCVSVCVSARAFLTLRYVGDSRLSTPWSMDAHEDKTTPSFSSFYVFFILFFYRWKKLRVLNNSYMSCPGLYLHCFSSCKNFWVVCFLWEHEASLFFLSFCKLVGRTLLPSLRSGSFFLQKPRRSNDFDGCCWENS